MQVVWCWEMRAKFRVYVYNMQTVYSSHLWWETFMIYNVNVEEFKKMLGHLKKPDIFTRWLVSSFENETNDMACGKFHILEIADAIFQQVSGLPTRYTEVRESWYCSFLCLLCRQQLEGKPGNIHKRIILSVKAFVWSYGVAVLCVGNAICFT